MKIVFFGTPAFAVPTLERLLASIHPVVGVVTQPDRPRGRGHRVAKSPVKEIATTHSIPTLQPLRMKDPDFVDALTALGPDLAVVAAYGKILPGRLLALPRLGMINVHASLLPRYRGAAPIHRAVVAGETETGITIIRLVQKMDAGPMLRKATVPIGADDTSVILERTLAVLGAETLMQTVDELDAGHATEEAQDHDQATLAPRLIKEDGIIDWSRPAGDVHNLVRGLHPWPHAFSHLSGVRYLIRQTSVIDLPPLTGSADRLAPGQVLEAKGDRLTVAAGLDTAVAILEIQPEGRRPLPPRAFLAGHPVAVGSVFAPST